MCVSWRDPLDLARLRGCGWGCRLGLQKEALCAALDAALLTAEELAVPMHERPAALAAADSFKPWPSLESFVGRDIEDEIERVECAIAEAEEQLAASTDEARDGNPAPRQGGT